MKDKKQRPVSIYGIYYRVDKGIFHYYTHRKKFFPVSIRDQGSYGHEIYHMRLLTPSLIFAVRIFKRTVIQYLLKTGDLQTAKAVARARMCHPDDRDTCMVERFPYREEDFPQRDIDWNESRIWGKRTKFSKGPWYTWPEHQWLIK